MAEVIIDFIGQSNMKPVEESLNKIDGLLDEQKQKYNEVNQSASKISEGLGKTEKAAKGTASEFDKLSKGAKDTAKALSEGVGKKVADELGKAGKAADGLTNQFKSAKAELRSLQNQITSGKLSGEQLEAATRRAAELRDNISDVSDAIQQLSSDTRVFDLAVEGARGMTAAFSVAQGATALFGKENEDLQKAILRVQASMTLLTGVQELANIATTNGGIVTTAYGYAIKGVEAIQKVFAVSSAAAWAIATAGISLALTAVVALVAVMADFIGKSEDGVKKFEELSKKSEKLYEGKKEAQERFIDRLKAEGKTEEEINKVSQANAKANMALMANEIKELEKKLARRREVLKYDKDDKESLKLANKYQEEINKKKKEYYEQETNLLALQLQSKESEKQTAAERKKAAEDLAKEKIKQNKQDDEKAKDDARRWLEEQKRIQETYRNLEDNRKLQLALENDFNLTRKEIDEDYARFVEENAKTGRTSFAEYESQKRAELEKTKQEQIKAAQDQIKAENELRKNRDLQLQLMIDTGLTQKEIDDEYYAWVQTKREDEKASFEEFEKFKRDQLKQTAEESKKQQEEIQKAALSIVQTAFDTIFEIGAANRQAETEAALKSLDEQKNAELEKIQMMAEDGVITKEQEEERKAAITEKYMQREREIKRRQWEADKQAKIAQATINGALAITNAMAQTNPIMMAIQIAMVAATTAAQIAIISSTKPPQFAKGTKGNKKTPAGFKIVGEEGPELIYTPGGEKVITAPDTAKILENYNINTAKMPQMKDNASVTQVPLFDYDRLSKAVAGELTKQPRLQINIDEQGFTKRLLEGRKRVEYLNNKFKFN